MHYLLKEEKLELAVINLSGNLFRKYGILFKKSSLKSSVVTLLLLTVLLECDLVSSERGWKCELNEELKLPQLISLWNSEKSLTSLR